MLHHTNMKRFMQYCCVATLYFHEVVALQNRIMFGTTEPWTKPTPERNLLVSPWQASFMLFARYDSAVLYTLVHCIKRPNPSLPGHRRSPGILNSPYFFPTYGGFQREDPLTSSSRYLCKSRFFFCALTLSSPRGPPTEPEEYKKVTSTKVLARPLTNATLTRA